MSVFASLTKQTSFPETYERELVAPLFRPWAEALIDDVSIGPGDRVLDVACGTGIVARLARSRLGADAHVVGVDANAAMLAVARSVDARIDWRQGDAASLPLAANERFDVAFCQQGLQFFADRLGALQAMHAALASGGRAAVSVWRSDEELPLLRELRRAAERHVGALVDRRHCFGDAQALESLLVEAGFRDARVRQATRTIRFEHGSAFLRLNAVALVGMSAASASLGEEERSRLADAIASEGARAISYGGEGALSFELAANVAVAMA